MDNIAQDNNTEQYNESVTMSIIAGLVLFIVCLNFAIIIRVTIRTSLFFLWVFRVCLSVTSLTILIENLLLPESRGYFSLYNSDNEYTEKELDLISRRGEMQHDDFHFGFSAVEEYVFIVGLPQFFGLVLNIGFVNSGLITIHLYQIMMKTDLQMRLLQFLLWIILEVLLDIVGLLGVIKQKKMVELKLICLSSALATYFYNVN